MRIAASKRTLGGWALTSLAVGFLTLDGTMKVLSHPAVLEASVQLGYPAGADFARLLGGLLLACTVLYAFPATAGLGAVLLTGYLGGAVASHLRLGHPLFSHVLFGVYVGVVVWGGLYLRDPRLRAFLPVRRRAAYASAMADSSRP